MGKSNETQCDYKRLLLCFVRLDLRAKYIGSVMGLVWTVFQPLFMLAVYTFVFVVVLNVSLGEGAQTKYYTLYLFSGLLPWHAFQRGVMRATPSLIDNAGLIKKVAFPVNIVPVYLSVSELVSEGVGFILLLGTIWLIEPPIHLTVFFLPLLWAVQLLFTIGLGWIAACGNAYFRDVQQFMSLLMMAWFFGTPIIYPIGPLSTNAPWVHTLLNLNPMTHLVRMYRDVLLEGTAPNPLSALIFCAATAIIFGLGWVVFRRNEKLFADLI